MSKKIFGNEKNIKQPLVKNNGVATTNVSVNIDSYLNRKTEAKTINSYIEARGGFDRGLWQPPLVAELPSGKRYLFDGDHRRKLWTLAYPQKTDMPVQVVKVKDEEEISRLFVAINKTARKSLTPNEVFVHEVKGNVGNARNVASVLEECGLSVSLGTKESGSIVGDINGPEVSISGFQQGLKSVGKPAMIYASSVITKVFQNDRRIRIELLRAISNLRKNVPEVEVKFANEFEKVINNLKISEVTQKDIASKFKQSGGARVNQDEECITYGLIKHLRKQATAGQFKTLPTYKKYFSSYEKMLKDSLS
tara:strand:+ start:840 stop:1763 length:924 start_codon:yes stop_codon:yes gene_type:complete